VYVVWSPQLGAQEKHAGDAAELLPDKRAHHYWDGAMVIGSQYQTLRHPGGTDLHLESPAWDVWMLFGPNARWGVGRAPDPTWWEHQLGGMPEDVRLDPERFAVKAAEILSSSARP
jgi:hypothetical protein